MYQLVSLKENRAMRMLLVMLLGVGFVIAKIDAPRAQSILPGNKLIYKAPIDECFYGVGNPNNTPAGFQSPCPSGSTAKVDGAYIWGMTESVGSSGKYIWFGTVDNYLCQVIQTLFAATGTTPPTSGLQTPSYVCEFNQSQSPNPGPAAGNFDWRQPQIYHYNLNSPASPPVLATLTTGMANDLSHTQGLRSAGSSDKIVFLAGPSGAANPSFAPGPALFPGSITLFAFTPSGTPIGSTTISKYTDIRKWVFVNGNLYTGVQNASDATGRVLLWVGTTTNPFTCPVGTSNCYNGFQEVGYLDAEAANLTTMNGRIYATTWGGFNGPAARTPNKCPSLQPFPGATNQQCQTGLWVSPPLPLTPTSNWTEIWDVSQYEPDPATAFSIVGGAVEAYNGQIYWGTMQVPMTGYITHCLIEGPADPKGCPSNSIKPANALASLILTVRPTSVFRSNGSATQPTTELLYGAAQLPLYNVGSQTWTLVNNKMGVSPTYGPIGFGNPFNAYTWSAAVYQNRLYLGTFDWSYLAYDAFSALVSTMAGLDPNNGPLSTTNVQSVLNNLPSDPWWSWSQTTSFIQALKNKNPGLAFGADLWRFDSPNGPAKAESNNGLGNYLNYGIRSMVADPNQSQLWVGTANPMNLKTTPGQPPGLPYGGGWEFRALTGAPVF